MEEDLELGFPYVGPKPLNSWGSESRNEVIRVILWTTDDRDVEVGPVSEDRGTKNSVNTKSAERVVDPLEVLLSFYLVVPGFTGGYCKRDLGKIMSTSFSLSFSGIRQESTGTDRSPLQSWSLGQMTERRLETKKTLWFIGVQRHGSQEDSLPGTDSWFLCHLITTPSSEKFLRHIFWIRLGRQRSYNFSRVTSLTPTSRPLPPYFIVFCESERRNVTRGSSDSGRIFLYVWNSGCVVHPTAHLRDESRGALQKFFALLEFSLLKHSNSL